MSHGLDAAAVTALIDRRFAALGGALGPRLRPGFDALLARQRWGAAAPGWYTAPESQPILVLVLALADALGDAAPRAAVEAALEAAMIGYAYVRVHDDWLDDGVVATDPETTALLADTLLTHHMAATARAVGDGEPAYWDLFATTWGGFGEAMLLERALLRGRLDDAVADHAEVLTSARQRGNTEHESWSLTFAAPVLLALGGEDQVAEQLAATELLVPHLDPFTHVGFHGVRAQLRARRGDLTGALADAAEMLSLYGKHPLALFNHLPGFGGAGEAVLLAMEAAGRGETIIVPDGWTLKTLVRKTLGLTSAGAFSFVYFRPRKQLLAGTRAWILGRRGRALSAWSRGLILADSLRLPYEAALIALERARLLPASDPARVGAAAEAQGRLQALGAVGDSARLDAAARPEEDPRRATPEE